MRSSFICLIIFFAFTNLNLVGQNLYPTTVGSQVHLPGMYNFEQINLGQYGNGAAGLELINHVDGISSYGTRLFTNVDNGIAGIQIQTAPVVSSYSNLKYITRLAINLDGNVGIGALQPSNKLQIGDFNNREELKLCLPGVYNFEQIKIGQYGQGASGLEMVNHVDATSSYGTRIFSNVDNGIAGLQIQTAPVTSSYSNLKYITRFVINLDGNIGIGTSNPTTKLAVNGTIRCQEVLVEATPWPDYVFAKNYKLKSLAEVDTYIKANNHLPDMPAASDVEQNGVKLSELNTKLVQKVEELTLYIIEQNKQLQTALKRIEKLEAK